MKKKKPIASPCISVCTIEEDHGFCRGCFRSLGEIAQWNALSEGERSAIMAELDKRRQLHGDSGSPYSA